MGTNYYLRIPSDDACPTCGRGSNDENLHIGKSSAGWCFALHIIPEQGINDLSDWIRLFNGPGKIEDEYGAAVPPAVMVNVITCRSNMGAEEHDAHFLRSNHAAIGPNGLLRNTYKARPGDGTYDLCEGEFS